MSKSSPAGGRVLLPSAAIICRLVARPRTGRELSPRTSVSGGSPTRAGEDAMTTPRRTFLGITAISALAIASLALADPRRILLPLEAGAPVASGRLSELERAVCALRIGGSSQHGGLTVFWLTSVVPASALSVETLEEARASGALAITERAAPTVPELVVDNRGKSHILLMAGEILVGGKQNRVLREDILLPPLSGARSIGVYCVEAGRWNEGRRDFEDRKSTRLNSSHLGISYAVFCLK